MVWGGGGSVLSHIFLLLPPPQTYEWKKRHNKQYHCALATLPNVTDEHTLLHITQIAHCSASTTRESHLFKAIDSSSGLKACFLWIA